jgi:hypothetical protein
MKIMEENKICPFCLKEGQMVKINESDKLTLPILVENDVFAHEDCLILANQMPIS